jgi:bifunctional DNA-binding transcriptional regulator/antitoxin component of YhaV-PrlF toxin-antitoxin module
VGLLIVNQVVAQKKDSSLNFRGHLSIYKNTADSIISNSPKIPYLFKSGNYYIFNDNLFYAEKDTLVIVSDTSGIHYSQTIKSQYFYNNIKQKSKQNIITRELYNQLIIDQPKQKKESFTRADRDFTRVEGKIINSISLKQLDIFGPSVNDTSARSDRKKEILVNNTHINTLPKIIRNALIINIGDKVESIKLADNERILRKYKAIHDAKIIATINPHDTNFVDLMIVTQDAFPFGLGGQVYDVNRGRIDFKQNNIIGTGHQLINRLYYDDTDQKQKGYFGTYRISNLFNTFIIGEVDYYNLYYKNYMGVNLNRDFFTPDIKYAGAFKFYVFDEEPELLINDSIYRQHLQYRTTDFWIGRNFNLGRDYLIKSFRPGINISARYIGQTFYDRPDIYADSATYYYNYKRLIGKIGYSNQKFYESNMIYSSGKTEDIPTGYLVELLAGTEFDDFEERGYIGSNIAFASTIKKKYYFYNQLGLGTYFKAWGFEQSVLRCYTKIISPLIKTRGPLLRQFFTMTYTEGFNLKSHEYIDLKDDKYGLSSWNKNTPYGNYRFTFSTETVIFPKWYFYGVGSTLFSFIDIGSAGDTRKNIFKNTTYASIGGGFRLRNDKFIINSIEIRLAWFPVVPEGKNWSYYISSEQTLSLDELKPGIPEIIPFE